MMHRGECPLADIRMWARPTVHFHLALRVVRKVGE